MNTATILTGRPVESGPWIAEPQARLSLPATVGLHRPRLAVALDTLWSKRLALVTAPPGSGKSTLVAGWARRCGSPVAWYSAEPVDASEGAMLSQLHHSLSQALTLQRPWQDPETALEDIGRHPGRPVVLVIDDFHVLAGTEAEGLLAQLLARLPPTMRVLVTSRQTPALNLSRLRLDDDIVELGADDLRFRSWEAESLFREHYGCPMLPEEVSLLTRKTEGWAAGLQLFHLAARDRSPTERARMLAGFSAQSRPVADYLADNVLAGLDARLVEFMIRTCPLGVLTGALCDELLDAVDSKATLAEMERRQLFVSSNDGGQTYHYHAILRSHLDGCLVDQLGEAGARQWHYRAGRLMLSSGFPEAALQALCRAEAWEKASAVLAQLHRGTARSGDVAGGCSTAMDTIPARILDSEPWVVLARARCHVASGQMAAAVAAYRACEPTLPRRAADTCRAEMVTVSAWASTMPSPAPGWTNVLRRALARDPLVGLAGAPGNRAAWLDEPTPETTDPDPGILGHGGGPGEGRRADEAAAGAVAGLCALMAGEPRRASGILQEAATSPTSPMLGLGARLAGVLASLLRREPDGIQIAARRALAMAGEAERLGSPWLARQAYALLALAGRPNIAAQVSAQCHHEADPWGETLAQLLEGAGRLVMGEAPVAVLSLAAGGARSLGAGVLEAWALSCLAIAEARAGTPQAREAGLAAEAMARRAGVLGAQALAHVALGLPALGHRSQGHRSQGRQAVEHLRLARALADECGLGILGLRPAPRMATIQHPKRPAAPRLSPDEAQPEGVVSRSGLSLRCLGALVVSRDGQVLDLGSLRPRARALLALLAVRHPLPVHCEVLTEALWPDTEPRSGAHRLQTAISSVRRALAPHGPDSTAPNPVVRHGEAYLLLADRVDVAELEYAARSAATSRRANDTTAELAALGQVLSLHRAELLPELGPLDWVAAERDRLRWTVTDCAERLAELELAAGHHLDALSAARTGLQLDRYRESLWRLAIRAASATDDQGLVTMLSRNRADARAELGIVE
ncbi:MAG: BTAD domain-containing putative transcriptional regulator [Acidimicrobiales bacterium]